MSDKDRQLIDRAWDTPRTDAQSIDSLIAQAESKECKERLHTIQVRKFSME